MASIQNRNGKFRIRFRYLGKPFARSIDKRSKEKGRRGTVVAATIRKEITTLFSILQWAVTNGHVDALPSKRGLRYPKGKQQPIFQTWDEIDRKVKRGGLTDDEISEL